MEDNPLVFAEPPTKRDRWTSRIKQLQAHPGAWVDATLTWGLRGSAGHYSPLHAKGLEVVTTKHEDGTSHLYVRWPAEPAQQETESK